MRYFGKRSISSVMAVVLQVIWIGLLILSIAALCAYTLLLVFPEIREMIPESFTIEFQREWNDSLTMRDIEDWAYLQQQPLWVQALVIPYGMAIAFLLLKILGKTRQILRHFSKDRVFHQSNTKLLKQISLYNLIYGVITFIPTLMLLSVVIFILCKVFERGSNLQEEQDLTV